MPETSSVAVSKSLLPELDPRELSQKKRYIQVSKWTEEKEERRGEDRTGQHRRGEERDILNSTHIPVFMMMSWTVVVMVVFFVTTCITTFTMP